MHYKHYVSNWLSGIGRQDLARKAEEDKLPWLNTDEALAIFRRWQRNEISRDECLDAMMNVEVAVPKL